MRGCVNCGKELFLRLMPSGRMESPQSFGYRKFCNRDCRTGYALLKDRAAENVPFQSMARQLWNAEIQL